MLPSCHHLFIIIRADKGNKGALFLKGTGKQASWLKKKKCPGCKPNSLFFLFSSPCPISGLCFLVSIFSSRSIPLQLVPVIFKQREKLILCRWEIIKLNITQPLKCRQLITRAKLNILTDVVLDWLISPHSGVAILRQGQHSPLASSQMGFCVTGPGPEE